jgi:hypothetical protein
LYTGKIYLGFIDSNLLTISLMRSTASLTTTGDEMLRSMRLIVGDCILESVFMTTLVVLLLDDNSLKAVLKSPSSELTV